MSSSGSSHNTMKNQVLADAHALYGGQHPKSSRYEIIITRTYSSEKGKSTHRAALIVYPDPGSPSVWKLLKKSRPNATPYDALDQLDIWIRDELDDVIDKMQPGDICNSVESKQVDKMTQTNQGGINLDKETQTVQEGIKRKRTEGAATVTEACEPDEKKVKG